MKLTEAFAILNMTKETCTRENFRQAWRAYAWKHHPDRGGDVNAFVKGDTARQHIERYLIKVEREGFKCQWCDGKGETVTQRGFQMVRKRCAKCAGTGRLPA